MCIYPWATIWPTLVPELFGTAIPTNVEAFVIVFTLVSLVLLIIQSSMQALYTYDASAVPLQPPPPPICQLRRLQPPQIFSQCYKKDDTYQPYCCIYTRQSLSQQNAVIVHVYKALTDHSSIFLDGNSNYYNAHVTFNAVGVVRWFFVWFVYIQSFTTRILFLRKVEARVGTNLYMETTYDNHRWSRGTVAVGDRLWCDSPLSFPILLFWLLPSHVTCPL